MSELNVTKDNIDIMIKCGDLFQCRCGASVFKRDNEAPIGKVWYVCNGCQRTYESDDNETI